MTAYFDPIEALAQPCGLEPCCDVRCRHIGDTAETETCRLAGTSLSSFDSLASGRLCDSRGRLIRDDSSSTRGVAHPCRNRHRGVRAAHSPVRSCGGPDQACAAAGVYRPGQPSGLRAALACRRLHRSLRVDRRGPLGERQQSRDLSGGRGRSPVGQPSASRQ